MSFFKNLFSKLLGSSVESPKSTPAELEPLISITDDEIICNYPTSNKIEKVNWQKITKVEVLTTDEGPYVCDVFILISEDACGVAIPQEKEECKQVIDKIFSLPGFDFKAFTQAMGSTDNKRFTVWLKI